MFERSQFGKRRCRGIFYGVSVCLLWSKCSGPRQAAGFTAERPANFWEAEGPENDRGRGSVTISFNLAAVVFKASASTMLLMIPTLRLSPRSSLK